MPNSGLANYDNSNNNSGDEEGVQVKKKKMENLKATSNPWLQNWKLGEEVREFSSYNELEMLIIIRTLHLIS